MANKWLTKRMANKKICVIGLGPATEDGLSMMQTTSIAGAFPFLLIMLFSVAAIINSFT